MSKQWFVEHYYMHRLESTDEGIRLRAVEALGEAHSLCAVPYLIQLLEKEQREDVRASAGFKEITMTPVAYALYRFGKGALPRLREAELLEMKPILKGGGRLVWWSGKLLGIPSEIISAMNSPGQVIRVVSYEDAVEGYGRAFTELLWLSSWKKT